MGELDGKVCLVTGGATGIGKGIALEFARAGALVALASRSREKLEAASAEIRAEGATAEAFPADVTDEPQVVGLFAAVARRFGRLDVLVNNAGTFEGGPLDELSLESWRRVLDVNLTGPFLCTREALKAMKRQGGGRIINVGSISAQVPRPNTAPYAVSKHGLVGLTKCAALEGRAYGVSAGCLHPGNTRSDLPFSDPSEAKEPFMQPRDVARAVLAMAALPGYANLLEAIILPVEQLYVGRG